MKDLLVSFCEWNSSLIILLFVRDVKKRNGVTVPFVCLGPADLVNYESERPIKVIWKLRYPMPAEMYEENRRGG